MKDQKTQAKEDKAKMLRNMEMSYRLGYEHGAKETKTQMQSQQMTQMMNTPQPGQVDQNGNPIQGQPGQAPQQGQPDQMQGGVPQEMIPGQDTTGAQDEMQNARELDNHINELQSLVEKGEKPKVTDIRRVVLELAELRKSQKEKVKLNTKETLNVQKQTINRILKKWENEQKDTLSDIDSLIKDYENKNEK